MSDKATLLALAERVEALIAPDRVVDAEIARALNVPPLYKLPGHIGATWPNYTASLDAAMTLEPEGLESEEIYPPDDECPVWTSHIVIRGNLHSGTGNTRVLAQLASRLRARAETQP